MAKPGKIYRTQKEQCDANKHYSLSEAISQIKAFPARKFDQTIDIAMHLGVDPRHSDQMVRGVVSLPQGTGKSVRVAVFAKGDQAEAARKAGAELVGDEDLAEQISKGMLDFDRCIATPDLMAVVGKLGKVLGPKGLMPNPKLGTVTQDVAQAVEAAKAGQVEYRVEKAGVIHAGLGKVSFDVQAIKENILAFVGAVQAAKPSGAKGTYIKSIYLSLTMGPALAIDIPSLLEEI